MSVKFLELESIIHATESLDKVLKAVKHMLLRGCSVPIVLEVYWGHCGNPIVRLKVFIDDEKATTEIFRSLCRDIENLDVLINTVESRLDQSGTLYIRLDKDKLLSGKLFLNDESDNVVRLKLRLSRSVLKRGVRDFIVAECKPSRV